MGFELGWICVWQNYGRLGFWRGEGLGDSYPSGHLHQSDCVYMEDDIAWGLSFPYIWQERIGLPVMGWKGFYRPYHYAESLSYGEDSLSVYWHLPIFPLHVSLCTFSWYMRGFPSYMFASTSLSI